MIRLANPDSIGIWTVSSIGFLMNGTAVHSDYIADSAASLPARIAKPNQ